VNVATTPQQLPPAVDAVAFQHAVPTLAHMAIVALHREGFVRHVVSQNVDGLHLRSGLPRAALSELHGNLFVEMCASCGREHVREYQIDSVGFKLTGRMCTACEGPLADKALDWDDALPEPDFSDAIEHSRTASLAVIVGSSCQMNPARNLPFRCGKGGRVAIVNLSRTQKDSRCAISIRAKCDQVFAVIVRELGVAIPPYRRSVNVSLKAERLNDGEGPSHAETLAIRCAVTCDANAKVMDPIPWLSQVSFQIVGCPAQTPCEGVSSDAPRYISNCVKLSCAPFAATLTPCLGRTKSDDQGAWLVRACLSIGQGLDSREEVLQCSLAAGLMRGKVLSSCVDYNEAARKLCVALEEDAVVSRKRSGDVETWYTRSAKRRGYVRCAGCDGEVFARMKGEHLADCIPFTKSESHKTDVKVKRDPVAAESDSISVSYSAG
jgi:NAD-dependent SIR2 family protein deacetylase